MNESPAAFYLHHLGMVNCLGQSADEIYAHMMLGDRSGFVEDSDSIPGATVLKGVCDAELPSLPPELSRHTTRNNQLILAAILQVEDEWRATIARYGSSQVAVVIGSSTSGIREGEAAAMQRHASGAYPADFHLQQQGMGSPSDFIAAYLEISGPAYTISSACTSSAKALASARNLLAAGICKAVVTGGSDSLCGLTLNGFFSLDTLSRGHCNPMSKNRDGIVIGEACALFLMTCEGPGIRLLGTGESSDAHHISAPQPEGIGAEAAMRAALRDAALAPGDIDYINLHGTATPQNDAMESNAVERVFGTATPCSSTKGLTGHTLGAAGATEAGLCWLALDRADGEMIVPPHRWDEAHDDSLPPLNFAGLEHTISIGDSAAVLSSSFAFGGSNCCIVLGKKDNGSAGDGLPYAIEDVLPHRGRMILLDSIVACSVEHAESLAKISDSNIFFDPARNGVPAWIGYEYMAQTMAAHSGIRARIRGEAVRVGLLVGNRSGTCHVPYFLERQVLHTSVHLIMDSDGMGVFDCKIEDADTRACLMEAIVNVFLPPDIEAFIKEARAE